MEKRLLFILILFVFTQACTHMHNDQLYITATPNEMVKIPLDKIFKNQKYDQMSFNTTQDSITITDPISQSAKLVINGMKDAQIISYKFEKQSSSPMPLNQATILVLTDQSYFAEQHSKPFNTIPIIDTVIGALERQGTKFECFDIVSIGNMSIADCTTDAQDYFTFAITGSINRVNVTTTSSSKRKLEQIDNFIYRSSVNKLELYQYKDSQLTELYTIDSQKLITLLKKDDFILEIVDFKTHTNGQVSILNSSGELIILEYQNDDFILVKLIETKEKNIISYDYDIYTNSYTIILEASIVYVNKDGQKFVNIIVTTGEDSVYLTQNYIIFSFLNSVKVYNQALTLMYSTTLSQLKCQLFTKMNDDGFVYMDKGFIYYYTIQDKYYLKFQQEIQDVNYKLVKLTQKESPLSSCDLIIFYQVIGTDSFNIYQQQDEQAVLEGSYYAIDEQVFKFNPIFSGPRLQYDFSNLLIKIDIFNSKVVEFKNQEDQGQVTFRKLLPHSEQVFYLISQNEQLEIFGQSCLKNDNQEVEQITCSTILNKLVGPKLQSTKLQVWWSDQYTFYFAQAIESDVEIYFLNTEQKEFTSLTTFKVEGKIIQIQSDGQHLYILTDQSTQIFIVTINEKQKLILTLETATSIFASQVKPFSLFLVLSNQIKLYQINEMKVSSRWIQQLTKENLEINISIFKDQFVLLAKNYNKAKVYNFQNFQNIFEEKELSFYDCTDIDYSSVTSDYESDYLYMKAQIQQETVVLVYNLQQPSLNTQFTSIKTTSTTILTATHNVLLVTESQTNSNLQNYLLTGNYNTKSKFVTTYVQQQYTTQVKLSSSVFNEKITRTLQNLNLTIVNRGAEIFPLKHNLILQYPNKDNSEVHCVDFDQSWYMGQVMNWNLANETKIIELKKPIQKLNGSLDFSPFISEFDDKTLIQLNKNNIILVSKENLTKKESVLDDTYEYTNLLVIKNSLVFVEAIKKQSNNYELLVIKCENGECLNIQGSKSFIARLRRAYIDQNFFFLLVGNTITAFEAKGDFSKLSEFEEIRKITSYDGSYISQIQFSHLKDNIYQFILLELTGNLEFSAYEISKTSQEQYFTVQKLPEYISQKQLYYPTGQTPSGLYYNKPKNELIVAYSKSAAYAFEVVVDCSKNKLCDIPKFEYLRAYQQYGNSYISNEHFSSYMNENILSQVYLVNDHYELFLYDLNTPTENQQTPKLAFGGLTTPIFVQTYQVQSFVYSYNNKLYLLASAENKEKLYQYQLLRSLQACIKSEEAEETIQFSLSNSFSKVEESLQLKIQKIPDDDSKNSFPVWAIILIVVGAIAIIGFVAYKCIASKKKNVQDERYLLGQ